MAAQADSTLRVAVPCDSGTAGRNLWRELLEDLELRLADESAVDDTRIARGQTVRLRCRMARVTTQAATGA